MATEKTRLISRRRTQTGMEEEEKEDQISQLLTIWNTLWI